MPLSDEALRETVAELSRRPGHEKVRALIYKMLTDSLGAKSSQILFERQVPEIKGRIDALFERTVFEIKSDLRKERSDAEAQLARYLPEREAATKQKYVGLATDGAEFFAHEMRDGKLREISQFKADAKEPRRLSVWLEGVVAVSDQLPADAPNIIYQLGRQSPAFARSLGLLKRVWDGIADHPEATLKRQLWARHLGFVYGKAIDDDELWLQHTYLVTVAKAIAAGAMGFGKLEPRDLLSGKPFRDAAVVGAVEEDFFSWILDAPGGFDIVNKIARHAERFDLGDVDVDLLKILYESLIDPKQRHDLGEYYTPDWLAKKVVRRALENPADESVLDPACGSGSFLFHAVRLKREALDKNGVPLNEVAARCCADVRGIDVHPVAVIFARVTYLLALGSALQKRAGEISVPVYLGDSLQWNVRRDAAEQDLIVEAPPDPRDEKKGGPLLRFPLALCANPVLFDRVMDLMHEQSEAGRSPAAFARAAKQKGVNDDHLDGLRKSYETYDALRREGRDHLWTFFARNLSRPVALSDGPRADVVIGNPPWLSYRYMSKPMQKRFSEASRALGVWVGKAEARLVTQTDLSGLFFARAAQLYVRSPTPEREGGRIAMVMPLAALTRGQFRAFRSGAWHGTTARFDEAWVLDNQEIQPLFRVPTCVLFARRTHALASRTPSRVTAFVGQLPFKDAPEQVADRHVSVFDAPAPSEVSFAAASPYRDRFLNGATLYPRMLCLVERVETGRLGASLDTPLVQSEQRDRKGEWKKVEPLQGPIEAQFLRPVYLGESIAPFRVLGPAETLVPVLKTGDVLSSEQAIERGFTGLASWEKKAEELWAKHGSGKTSFKGQINHYGKLSSQFPIAPLRIVFGKAGTQPAACILRDERGVIDHMLYWAAIAVEEEGHYLAAILNSESVRARIAHMQARGEQGARHFDKLMFTLPIPRFDPREGLHAELAAAGQAAEAIAARVAIPDNTPFARARGLVRQALRDDGIAGCIDAIVDQLLGPDRDRPVAPAPPRLRAKQRVRWMAEAETASKRLKDDAREQALLDEIEQIQTDNADTAE